MASVRQMLSKLPLYSKKTFGDNLARITKFSLKNDFFINISKISSLTDACFRLRSYERGVAQLGSADALGAYLFTNENDCNNWLSYFYNKLYSDGK